MFTTAQLAEYLQVHIDTLAYWRRMGTGPAHLRIGKHVRYRASDIDTWVAEQAAQAAAA